LNACTIDDCPNDAAKGGLCWAHLKRRTAGQELAPPVEKRPESPLARLEEAALTYADAEDDQAFARAKDNLRKSALVYSRRTHPESIRRGIERVRRLGKRLGRPLRLTSEDAVRLVEQHGSIRAAARLSGIQRTVIQDALRRPGSKN